MIRLAFTADTRAGRRSLDARIESLVIAGWTGRDAAAVEEHIAELEQLGVKRPKTTPIFYRAAASLLTTEGVIEVAGGDTSGEVEPVIISLAEGLFVAVGSDHTDRTVEAQGVTLAKQLCAKPISAMLWPFDEVAPHWDRLILRSYATIGGHRRPYQEGPAAALRPPPELIAKYMNGKGSLPAGTVMFGGTLAVPGGIVAAERFDIELEDPVLNRRLAHGYDIRVLPVEG
jgi:uncharacterized protein DUF2848